MGEAEATARGYWLESELQIPAPTTRRLQIGLCGQPMNECEHRLMLLDRTEEDGSSPLNELLLHGMDKSEAQRLVSREGLPAWPSPPLRLGTWKRYRDDLAWLRMMLAHLGWELDDRERALMQALEDYQPACRVVV